MNAIKTRKISQGPMPHLQKEIAKRELRIDGIKKLISQDWDNINNPVPFITAQVPVYQMTEDRLSIFS